MFPKGPLLVAERLDRLTKSRCVRSFERSKRFPIFAFCSADVRMLMFPSHCAHSPGLFGAGHKSNETCSSIQVKQPRLPKVAGPGNDALATIFVNLSPALHVVAPNERNRIAESCSCRDLQELWFSRLESLCRAVNEYSAAQKSVRG